MSGPLVPTAPMAVAAGALSFFSPYRLPLLPGYLSFVTDSLGGTVVRSGSKTSRRTPGVGPEPGHDDRCGVARAALAFAYSLGLGIPFLVAAASADRAMAAFDWPRRHAAALMRVGGLMLVLVGALQVSGAWSVMIARLQGLISGFQLLL